MNVLIPCVCGRHEQDTVVFRQKLDFRAGLTIRHALILARVDDAEMSAAEMLTVLSEQYVLYGVESWSLCEPNGSPMPVTRAAIRDRLLANYEVALTLADAADEVYAEQILLPLLAGASTSSPATPTAPSTSATAGPTPRPKPSRRSSTTTTPTDVTGPTSRSPAGVSS